MEWYDVFLVGKTKYQKFTFFLKLFYQCNALHQNLNGILFVKFIYCFDSLFLPLAPSLSAITLGTTCEFLGDTIRFIALDY